MALEPNQELFPGLMLPEVPPPGSDAPLGVPGGALPFNGAESLPPGGPLFPWEVGGGVPAPAPSADGTEPAPVPAETLPELAPGEQPRFGVELAEPLMPWEQREAVSPGLEVAVSSRTGEASPLSRNQELFPTPEEEDAQADAEARRLLAGGAEGLAANRARIQAGQAELMRAERTRRESADAKIRAENLGTWQKTMGRIETDRQRLRMEAKAIADSPSGGWAESASGAQIVGAFISAIAGGLLAPYTGGRNQGMEMVTNMIEGRRRAQLSTIDGQLQSLQLDAGQAGELYRMTEAQRLADYEKIDQALAQEAAKYDPRGTRAQAIAEARQATRQKQMEALVEADDRLHKRAVDDAELEIKNRQLLENIAARRQDASFKARELALKEQEAQGKTLSPAEQKTLIETQYLVDGAQIHDTQGKHVGQAKRGPDGAKVLQENLIGYEEFRDNLQKLNELIASVDTSTFGPTMQRWPSETVAKINALRRPLVFSLARVMNGTGVLSNADVEAAGQSIPGLDTWTTSREPGAVAQAMQDRADEGIRGRLSAELKGYDRKSSYDPTAKYRARDALIDKKPLGAQDAKKVKEDALTPLSDLTRSDDETRAAAIKGRAAQLDAIGNRVGVDKGYRAKATAQLAKELEAGKLSQEEHDLLMSHVEANALIRPSGTENSGLETRPHQDVKGAQR